MPHAPQAMPELPEGIKAVDIFVCYKNTDLTEGRGYSVPYAWTDTYATALRLAKGKSTQGCDADVRKEIGFRVKHTVYGPVRLESPSKEDTKTQEIIDARRAATDKARAAGLSDEEIKLISGGRP